MPMIAAVKMLVTPVKTLKNGWILVQLANDCVVFLMLTVGNVVQK